MGNEQRLIMGVHLLIQENNSITHFLLVHMISTQQTTGYKQDLLLTAVSSLTNHKKGGGGAPSPYRVVSQTEM